MKQLKYLTLSLAALCMASCSQDEDYLSGGTDATGGDASSVPLKLVGR